MLTRQRELFQWMLGGILTAALIAGLAYFFNLQGRWVAQSEKMKILNAPKSFAEANGKGGGHMTVTFTSTSDGIMPGSLNLTATVVAGMDLSDLRYEWLLPDGVVATKGMLSGGLGSLSDGDEATLDISLSIPSDTNKLVHLQVYRISDGEKMGQVAQYNTLDQQTIERSMASKRELLESDRSPASEKPKMME